MHFELNSTGFPESDPANYGEAKNVKFWTDVSFIIGWVYLVAWSASFFPQAVENYWRKSVAGFSIEFAMMNPSGFFFYTFYNVGGRVDGFLGTGEVRWNDLVFSIIEFAMSSLQLV